MPTIEMELPDRVDSQIDRLVDQGDFINREQAIEEILSRGISAYNTTETTEGTDDRFDEMFEDDQQDPATRDDPGSGGRTF